MQGSVALVAAGKIHGSLRTHPPTLPASGFLRACMPASLPELAAIAKRSTKPYPSAILNDLSADFIQTNPDLYPPFSPSPLLSDGKVAVIGGGPAGLTAATDLALMGYGVTLFEAKPQLGGMLRYGIPGYRLPKDILDKEIQSIVDLGVEVKTDTSIASAKGSSQAQCAIQRRVRRPSDGFDAVFVATGAWMSRKLGIPGEDAQGVLDGSEFPLRSECRQRSRNRSQCSGDRQLRSCPGCRALRRCDCRA